MKRTKILWAVIAMLLVLPYTTQPAIAQVTCTTQWVPMSDGTMLATDVYMPEGDGPFPVVMMRNPYARVFGGGCFIGFGASMAVYAENGYVGIHQEVRGTNRSEGTFNPMFQEASDGYDAIEWAGTQSWSNGKVGLTSGSYLGLTQWQPATLTPPHLAAMAPGITSSDYHDNWTYVNGAFDLWFAQSWVGLAFVPDAMRRHFEATGLSPDKIDKRVNDFTATYNSDLLTEWVWQLPMSSFSVFRKWAPYYYDWLDHPTYDAYWAAIDVETRYSNVTVPTLNTGAWYDIFQVGTVRNFQGMRSQGGSEVARAGSKLVMSCCGHAGTSGAISWGPNSTTPDPTLEMRFFDHYLKGMDNGIDEEPAVQLYVLVPPDTGTEGSGFWIEADEFPLQDTQIMKYYLGSGGSANTRFGDGVLITQPPNDDAADRFVYDPRDPVPTIGGNMCCNDSLPNGAHDQSAIEEREDVLVYTSELLTEDLAVIGTVIVKLWATSSAPDTDFTAKLVDVHPDGFSHNVLDRIVRARYRNGSKSQPSLIKPGQAYEYTIELGNTATMFKAGHKIRIEISSSNFPHYDRNPNTGHPIGQDAKLRTAMQTILHDATHPSCIELPVVPSVSIPSP